MTTTVWVLIRRAMYYGEMDRIIGVFATEEAAKAKAIYSEYVVEEFEVKQ